MELLDIFAKDSILAIGVPTKPDADEEDVSVIDADFLAKAIAKDARKAIDRDEPRCNNNEFVCHLNVVGVDVGEQIVDGKKDGTDDGCNRRGCNREILQKLAGESF